jgi:aminoglycoside phosphotransferase (APT) family kinase protein
MPTPGNLIASGRDADIFEFGRGRVLRRSRNDRSMAAEARTMEFVRARGYPAPEVFDVSDDGRDLVMERIDGTTMVEAGAARPWRVRSMGRELAGLHQALHELDAPAWLPAAPVGAGDRVLHMDLHPLNVLVGPRGPVVIDWTNAAAGDPSVDMAVTWALIASGEVPASRLKGMVLRAGRGLLLDAFLKPFRREELRSALAEVVPWKCTDANMSHVEVARMRALL